MGQWQSLEKLAKLGEMKGPRVYKFWEPRMVRVFGEIWLYSENPNTQIDRSQENVTQIENACNLFFLHFGLIWLLRSLKVLVTVLLHVEL